MKYCLSILIIFCATSFNLVSYAGKHDNHLIDEFNIPQQTPFYFLNPVPVKVKLLDKIDLSFFRNRLVVLNYRYRLEVPDNESTGLDMKLRIWSRWLQDDLSELKIPVLDQEGGYKLVIEYTVSGGKEPLMFEKPFYVYRGNLASSATSSGNNEGSAETRSNTSASQTTAREETRKQPAVATNNTNPLPKENPSTRRTVEKITEKDTLLDLSNVKVNVEKYEGIKPDWENNVIIESAMAAHYGSPEKNADTAFIAEASVLNDSLMSAGNEQIEVPGPVSSLKESDILYLLNDKTGTIDTVSKLQRSGVSLDEQDSNGNTPLHFAVLSGMDNYALTLIELGANPDLKNNLELTPLHLAVLRNDEELTDALLKKGAEINLQGNTGYTALHIATELNNPDIVAYLILKGASPGIKTSQGLSSRTIARIQKNEEILNLLGNKTLPSAGPSDRKPPATVSLISSDPDIYPEINFNLPYDKDLAKKRQFNQVIQIVSVPLFIVSGSYTVLLKSKANQYYSLSRIAESEEMAKVYYEKTRKYDSNAYISGGVSLVSAFNIIRSTLRKKSLSAKMYKTINQGYIISK